MEYLLLLHSYTLRCIWMDCYAVVFELGVSCCIFVLKKCCLFGRSCNGSIRLLRADNLTTKSHASRLVALYHPFGVVVKSRVQQQLDLIAGKAIFRIVIFHIGYIGHSLNLQIYSTHRKHISCKMNVSDRENANGEGGLRYNLRF